MSQREDFDRVTAGCSEILAEFFSLLASRFCHSRQRFWAARTLPPLLRDTKSLCPEHAYALDII